MDKKTKLIKEEATDKDDKLNSDSLSDKESESADQNSEFEEEYESESDESLSEDEEPTKPYIPERLRKKPTENSGKKVAFKESSDESEESDSDNPLKLKKVEVIKETKVEVTKRNEEREKQLTEYFNNIKTEKTKENETSNNENLEHPITQEKDIKDERSEFSKKDETLEESLQRMQFEESLKQLINHLDSVKFTISPQELSHLFKSYPSILRPEVAATFLTGSNIAAVNNMITHGFKLDRRIEDYYNKMKEEVFEGLSDKEKKRLEDYYEIPDRWLKENIKDDGAGIRFI